MVKLAKSVPCKVIIHQYRGDIMDDGSHIENKGIYDFNQINPYLDVDGQDLVLKRLILPQIVHT
jgi:hypothetical protein